MAAAEERSRDAFRHKPLYDRPRARASAGSKRGVVSRRWGTVPSRLWVWSQEWRAGLSGAGDSMGPRAGWSRAAGLTIYLLSKYQLSTLEISAVRKQAPIALTSASSWVEQRTSKRGKEHEVWQVASAEDTRRGAGKGQRPERSGEVTYFPKPHFPSYEMQYRPPRVCEH